MSRYKNDRVNKLLTAFARILQAGSGEDFYNPDVNNIGIYDLNYFVKAILMTTSFSCSLQIQCSLHCFGPKVCWTCRKCLAA